MTMISMEWEEILSLLSSENFQYEHMLRPFPYYVLLTYNIYNILNEHVSQIL